MITDASFIVYVITRAGEKLSVQPNRNMVQALLDEEKELSFYAVKITKTRDLEDVLEDDVDDARFEAWEKASLSGKILYGKE